MTGKIAVFILICFFAVLLSTCSFAAETVKVATYAGDVKLYAGGALEASEIITDMQLKSGDRVKTGGESFVEMVFDVNKNNVVRIEENTDVVIMLKGSDKLELVDGTIFTRLKGLKKGETFQVKTPCAVCGARGTGWGTSTNQGDTTVTSFESKVFVRGLKKDGTPMEGMSWVNEGFLRNIKKFEKPGKMTKASEKILSEMKNKMKAGDMGNKDEKVLQADKGRETRREGALNKRDDSRLREIREDKQKDDSEKTSGSFGTTGD